MEAVAATQREAGRRPYVIPLGASTPLGAAAFAHAVTELLEQVTPPDVIVHSTSSGGTQAGLVAGLCAGGRQDAGSSASAPTSRPQALATHVRRILSGLADLIAPDGRPDTRALADADVEIDDGFVGEGYGVPTPQSREAIELLARTEALFLDPTYTAKAMAGLIVTASRRVQEHGHGPVLAHGRAGRALLEC